MALLERHTQLAELEAARRDAAAGRGSLVLVTGEAGVGKTALVEEFAEHLDTSVLWGLCDDLMTPRPLGPFRDMFADLDSRIDPDTFLDTVLEGLNGAREPTVAVVEDAHWADQASLDTIRFLGRRIGRMRALLIVTYRADEVSADHPLRSAVGAVPSADIRRVRLAVLSEDAVATLARNSGHDAARLYALTGGNPFYVTESLADPGSSVPLPVQDAVVARVGRLGDVARSCAELVSAVPGAAESWLLDACGVASGLDEAVRCGVLRLDRGVVTFSHELVRRAVEQRLSEAARENVNGRVLDALAVRGADPARMTHHAVRARRVEAVVQYAPRAAQRAAAVGADLEAFEHYMLALDHAEAYTAEELMELLEAGARSGYMSARFDEAYLPAARAIELCQSSGGQPVRLGRLLCLLSEIEWSRGRGLGAHSAVDQAVAALEGEPTGTEQLVNAYSMKSKLSMLDIRPESAIAWGEKAIALAKGHGSEPPADLLVTIGSARLQRSGDKAEILADALRIALERPDHRAAARAYINLADELTFHMRYDDARLYIEDGLAFLDRHDLLAAIHHLRAVRARWHLDQGRWSEAERDAKQATGLDNTSRALAELVVGLSRTRRGESSAAATLEHVARRADTSAEAQLLVPVSLARAELAWLAGDHAGVMTALKPRLDTILDSGMSRWLGEAALWQHRVGYLDATPDDAAAPYALQIAGRHRQAAACWAELGLRYHAADALAEAYEPELLLEALAMLDRLGAAPRAAMVRHRLTELGVGSVPRGPHEATRASPAGLTRRQTEVLRLLAYSLTYRAIADRLHISIKTVDHHVTAIRTKLGVGSRQEAVAVGHRIGILP